jgi:diguanylate cyclase (GGDEF)-like protein
MSLHVPTILFLTVLVALLTGVLLIFSWAQNRSHRSLAWWGVANLLGGAGAALLAARGSIPDLLSIDLANAVLFCGYGAMLCAARRFIGRPADARLLFGGAALWLIACQLPAFHASSAARICFISVGIAAYSWTIDYVLIRGQTERLASRIPAAVWACLHGASSLVRVPICLLALPLSEANLISHPLIGFFAVEAIVQLIAMSFLQIGMEKERDELRQKLAAQTDELTGAANRRSVLERAEALLAGCRDRNLSAAVLLLDLDRFKSINDTFGHDVGDGVLRATARTFSEVLRKGDLFGRVGGEEFACCLPNTSPLEAIAVAERLRAAISKLCLMSPGGAICVTASVGVASTNRDGYDFAELMKAADAALYEAKARGRDRVVNEVMRPAYAPLSERLAS